MKQYFLLLLTGDQCRGYNQLWPVSRGVPERGSRHPWSPGGPGKAQPCWHLRKVVTQQA